MLKNEYKCALYFSLAVKEDKNPEYIGKPCIFGNPITNYATITREILNWDLLDTCKLIVKEGFKNTHIIKCKKTDKDNITKLLNTYYTQTTLSDLIKAKPIMGAYLFRKGLESIKYDNN